LSELLARAYGEGVLAGEAGRLPLDRVARRRLDGDEEPEVRLGDPCGHRAVGGLLLCFGLPDLVGREVERLLLLEDRCRGKVAAHGLVQVLVAGLVRGEEEEGVAELPGLGPSGLEDRLRRGERRGLAVAAVRVVGAEDDEARLEVVSHILSRCGEGVHSTEVALLLEVLPEAAFYLARDRVRISPELFGPVLCHLRDGRLGRVPVARAVVVEVGSGGGEASERIAEGGGRLAGHDAAELDPPVLEPAVRRAGRRR